MTVVCPDGHHSDTTDYCDQCGAPIARVAPGAVPAAVPPQPMDEVDTSAATPQQPCPACGAERARDDRYCEECGYDFVTPPRTAQWEAVVTADRGQFERFAATALAFPENSVPRRFALDGAAVRIGRSRGSPADVAPPEIDLAGMPSDPGISHLHAILERRDDGSYAVRDLGSTNGTTVNDDPAPVGRDAAVPLRAGDRIHLGAWTTIALRLASEVVPGEDA